MTSTSVKVNISDHFSNVANETFRTTEILRWLAAVPPAIW